MSRRAFPRVAKLQHFRSGRGVTLVLRVTDGPASEVGKPVHVPLARADLPVLRQVIEAIERQGEGS